MLHCRLLSLTCLKTPLTIAVSIYHYVSLRCYYYYYLNISYAEKLEWLLTLLLDRAVI